MNTKISYLYRDADNYKMHNKCVIAGTLTTEQTRTIKDSCEMGEYFIPRRFIICFWRLYRLYG